MCSQDANTHTHMLSNKHIILVWFQYSHLNWIICILVYVYSRHKKNAFEIFMLIFYSCIYKSKVFEIPKVDITIKLMHKYTIYTHPRNPYQNRWTFALFFLSHWWQCVCVSVSVCATWKMFAFVKVNQSVLLIAIAFQSH